MKGIQSQGLVGDRLISWYSSAGCNDVLESRINFLSSMNNLCPLTKGAGGEIGESVRTWVAVCV
jgi:hypothetical protein